SSIINTQYKDKYGDCKVPNRYYENKQLGNWVSRQRRAKKERKLSEERIQRLDAIGFVWNLKDK
ncbi:MAG: helicase associated domain-containing protein, partial [Candidatus Marithrix sp.]|nr:helicase associated domain-containing protein [Candidatus Marithrix sp.]